MQNQELKLIEAVRHIWNVIISEEQSKEILKKNQNIFNNYNLQKTLFGFNMFDGRGHKTPLHFK